MDRTPSICVRFIVGLCLCVGAVSGVKAQTINFTITGNLGSKALTGQDPLLLAGSPYTVTTSINPVGKSFGTGTIVYSGLSVSITATSGLIGQPSTFTCSGATATVVVGAAGDAIALSNCNIDVSGATGSFSATTQFAPNTIASPIPLAFNGNVLGTSTATYILGTDAPTEFNITGTTAAVCTSCPSLTLTPPSVTLTGMSGGTPQSQSVTVGTGGTVLAYALFTSTNSGGSWLSTSIAGGQSGGSFTVTATPGTLAAGAYSGTIKVYTAASNSPVLLPVTFNVSAASFNLVANPTSFTFNSLTGATTPSQSLSVTSSSGSSVSFSAGASSAGSWLSVSPASGTTGGQPITVSVNPAAVAGGGTYTGTITLTASGATNSPLSIPVTMNVTAVSASPTSLSYSYTTGASAPPAQTVSVTSTAGLANVGFTASASTTSGGNWLAVSPGSGTTNITSLSVSVIPGSLAAGTYNGSVNILPTGATTPITVPVTFTVTSAPSMVASPTSLSFSSTSGAVPASQTVGLTSSAGASLPISYNVAASTTSGGNWLTVTPGSGATPGTETVSINSGVLAGLATGVYNGTVVFTATTNALNSPLSVPVTLTVKAALTPSPASLTFNYTVGGTAPAAQAVGVTSNGGAIAYTATAATATGGNWLAVTPGSATTPTGVSVSVVPGSLTAGNYTGSITLASSGASNSPVSVPVTFIVAAEPTLLALPTSLTFNLTSLSSLPAAQSTAISASNSGAYAFTAAASTTSGGNWLSVTPGSGTTPGSVSVSITLNNLAAGIYSGSVKITAAGTANSPLTIPVQLNVTAAPTISGNPASLSFAYTLLSGTNPASQTTSITASNGAAIPFTAAATTTSGGNWLSVVPSGPNTPATLTVSVNTTGLTAGVYNGSISLTSAQASNSPTSIPVTFTVTAAPTISTSLSSLTYAFQIGGSNPAPQSFTVSSSGAALSFTAAAATTSGGNWLSVSPTGGTTPASVSATVNASALGAGTYNGSVTVTAAGASNGSVVIPVTLVVSSQASLTTAPSALTFNFTMGGTTPPSQTVNVGSTGSALTFSAATTTPWLTVVQNGSSTPGSLTVSVNTSGLAIGSYPGVITITASGASNSPLTYPVTMVISSQPSLSVGPAALTFNGQTAGANPASQTLSVASTAGTLSFTASATTTSGGSWLSVSPLSGSTNATLTVSVKTTGLAAGTYMGSISIAAPGAANTPVTVPVTLTLSSNALTVGPTSMSFAYQIAGTAPAAQTLTVGSTSTALSFTVASSASWLGVAPTSGTTLATLSVTINTTGLTPGTYTSAITITAAGASNSPLTVPVTLTVTAQPALVASPTALAFTYQTGGTAPAAQSLTITSTNTALTFAVTTGAAWLSAVPSSGITPGTLNVSVNTTGLTPGTYTSAISITAAGASNTPLAVPVTFTVTAQPGIVATPGTLAFSYAIGASTPAAQSVAISTSNGSAASFAASASTTTGGKWLAVTPASGSTPSSLMISVSAAGLAAGTYNGSVTITASGFLTQTVSVTLTVTQPTSSITVTGNPNITVTNTTVPVSTTLTISVSGGAALPYTVAAVAPQPTWLTFTPSSGTTPGSLTLTANAKGLYPGTYLAGLVVTVPGAATTTKTISVQLNVAGGSLLANPSTLSFTFQPGGTAPAAQSMTITPAPGGPATLPLGAITTTASWLTVSAASSAPATVQVSASLGLLTPGNYTASIYVSALGSTGPSLVVPVTLTISPLPQLTASPTALVFGYTTGGASPAGQSFALSSATVPLNFTVTSPGTWLTVSPQRGTTPASVLVTANPAGLGAGTYTGTITVSAYGAANPVSISVTLIVSGTGQLAVTPLQVSFASPVGGPAPASQTLSVSAGTAIGFTAASNAKWLTVTPVSGTTPASLTISANPAGLVAGTYLGNITVTPLSGSGTPVTMTVTYKVGSGTGTGTPTINAVTNAASGVAGMVSPGLWVSIFGNSLGPVTGVPFTAPPDGETVATILGGTQVLFDGTAVPLLYVSNTQVNALAPFELVGKTSTVMQIVSNGEVSASLTLPVVPAVPGLFTADSSGKGEGAILNQDSSVNSTTNPAAQGTIIVLYGTGGGQTDPASIDGGFNPLNADGKLLLVPVTVTIGGKSATVEYSGPAPGLVDGVIQINAQLPSGIGSGAIPVVVQIGTATSQTVTVAVQ